MGKEHPMEAIPPMTLPDWVGASTVRPHLRLGISIGAANAFVERINFTEFQVPSDSWVAKAYPDFITGYHLIEAILIWLVAHSFTEFSVVEILQQEGSTSVGMAEVF